MRAGYFFGSILIAFGLIVWGTIRIQKKSVAPFPSPIQISQRAKNHGPKTVQLPKSELLSFKFSQTRQEAGSTTTTTTLAATGWSWPQDLATAQLEDLEKLLKSVDEQLSDLSAQDLDKLLEACERVSRERENDYASRKLKLKALLALEIKHGRQIPLQDYEQLYDELLEFEPTSPNESAEASFDTDLIHVPFLRLSSMEKWDELARVSEDFIDANPDSILGYTYLASVYDRNGDSEGAREIIRQGIKSTDNEELVTQLIEQTRYPSFIRLMEMPIE